MTTSIDWDDHTCGDCGGEFSSVDLLPHLRDDHAYNLKSLHEAALQLGVNADMALCEHPNGFGPNGCSGCGDWGPAEKDTGRGLMVNGVTTQVYECESLITHIRHLHQPAKNSEWFTCLGRSGDAPRTAPEEYLKETTEAVRKLSESAQVPEDLLPPAGLTAASFRTATRPDLMGRIRDAAGSPEQLSTLGQKLATAFRFRVATGGLPSEPKLRPLTPEQAETGSLECPECGLTFKRPYVLLHLREEEAVDQNVLDEFADANGLDRLPSPNLLSFEFITSDQVPPIPMSSEDVLGQWWRKRAEEEVQAVVPKAVAYGSNSLMQLGRKVAQLQGRQVDDAEAMELGCWINAVQKIERWTDSVMRGERCSDDTIYDAGIYVKMVQRIRDVGSWPGV